MLRTASVLVATSLAVCAYAASVEKKAPPAAKKSSAPAGKSPAAGKKAAAPAKTPAATPELLARGKKSFSTNCASCHGDKGDGMGPAGQYLKPKPRNLVSDKFAKGETAGLVFQSITKGLPGTSMIGYGHLPEEERWALTHYVLSLRKKSAK